MLVPWYGGENQIWVLMSCSHQAELKRKIIADSRTQNLRDKVIKVKYKFNVTMWRNDVILLERSETVAVQDWFFLYFNVCRHFTEIHMLR